MSMPGLFNRRTVSTLAVLLISVTLAGACGSPGQEQVDITRLVCASGQIDGDLLVVNQTGLSLRPAIEQFERRYGVLVDERRYDSEEELLSRVNARADPVDLILMDESLAYIMRRDGLLAVLDPFALPSRANLYDQFAPQEQDLPGGTNAGQGFYWVPYLWGTVGMGINANLPQVETEPTWGLVFDLERAWVYTGRISLMDRPRQVLGAILLYLGFSPNTDDPGQVEQAAELLVQVRALRARSDSTSYAGQLVDGTVDIAQGRSDEFYRAIPDDSTDFGYLIPQEGAILWVDLIGVPVTSQNPCTAHSFIDFILEPRISGDIANSARVASPNRAALDFIDPLLVNDPLIYPPPEVMRTLIRLERTEDLNKLYQDQYLWATSL